MLSLEVIKEKLQDRNISKVAKGAGLSTYTIWKIQKGEGGVNYATVEKLSNYFEERP